MAGYVLKSYQAVADEIIAKSFNPVELEKKYRNSSRIPANANPTNLEDTLYFKNERTSK